MNLQKEGLVLEDDWKFQSTTSGPHIKAGTCVRVKLLTSHNLRETQTEREQGPHFPSRAWPPMTLELPNRSCLLRLHHLSIAPSGDKPLIHRPLGTINNQDSAQYPWVFTRRNHS